jgi:hypothetical protein
MTGVTGKWCRAASFTGLDSIHLIGRKLQDTFVVAYWWGASADRAAKKN